MQNNIIIGRVTKNIELKYSSNNKPIAELNIAISNGKKSNGEEDTTFINITCFDKIAENVSKYCNKGDLIGCVFTIKNHNYEDKKGNKRYEFSFIANKVNFLSKANKETPNNQIIKKDPYEDFGTELTEEDMPF